MEVREKNGVTYLSYPSFEKIPQVVHGFSTRLEELVKIYSSMNLSFTRGDFRRGSQRKLQADGQCVGIFLLRTIVTLGSNAHHKCACDNRGGTEETALQGRVHIQMWMVW